MVYTTMNTLSMEGSPALGSVEAQNGLGSDGRCPWQPGSAEYSAHYRASMDQSLSIDERAEAARAEVTQAQAEIAAVIAHAQEHREAPKDYVIVSHPDKSSCCSLAHPLGDGFHVCRHADLEMVRAHGFVVAKLPKAE